MTIEDIPRLVDLVALGGNVGSEGAPGLARSRHSSSRRLSDGNPRDRGLALSGFREGPARPCRFFSVHGRALDDARRMFQSACFDAHRSGRPHAILVAHVQAVDLNRDQIVMRGCGRYPFVVPGLRHGMAATAE